MIAKMDKERKRRFEDGKYKMFKKVAIGKLKEWIWLEVGEKSLERIF
jgi:hypothetical protein